MKIPARLFAGFDVACMTSAWGEGFPNVVGEAMACGTPCVATDVGATRTVIGSAGSVVHPNDPQAIATELLRLLRATPDTRRQLGEAARSVIGSQYTLQLNAAAYASLYQTTITKRSLK